MQLSKIKINILRENEFLFTPSIERRRDRHSNICHFQLPAAYGKVLHGNFQNGLKDTLISKPQMDNVCPVKLNGTFSLLTNLSICMWNAHICCTAWAVPNGINFTALSVLSVHVLYLQHMEMYSSRVPAYRLLNPVKLVRDHLQWFEFELTYLKKEKQTHTNLPAS